MRSNEQVKQQMFTYIAQWQQSGLTQKAYCMQNNIAYHVFHYWYKCYRDENGYINSKQASLDNGQVGFIPVQVHSSASFPAVELQLSDGKRLLFHQLVSSDYLKSLIS